MPDDGEKKSGRPGADVERSVSRKDRRAAGKALRDRTPRELHARWTAGPERRDPVEQVIEFDEARIPELVPVRHGRMMVSPFTYFRGAAATMAADLVQTPTSGIITQICGDCHLLNLGAYASPERHVIVDINDFDETLPGPWEWDIKRLAVSFVLAARSNCFSHADQRDAAQSCVRAYRLRMAEFAEMSAMDVWYARVSLGSVFEALHSKKSTRRLAQRLEREKARTVAEHEFPKLVAQVGGQPMLKDAPR